MKRKSKIPLRHIVLKVPSCALDLLVHKIDLVPLGYPVAEYSPLISVGKLIMRVLIVFLTNTSKWALLSRARKD